MNHDIKHYVHKAKWISDDLCDEAILKLNEENTWKAFPRDVVNAYEKKRPNEKSLLLHRISEPQDDVYLARKGSYLPLIYPVSILVDEHKHLLV